MEAPTAMKNVDVRSTLLNTEIAQLGSRAQNSYVCGGWTRCNVGPDKVEMARRRSSWGQHEMPVGMHVPLGRGGWERTG
jgi:hypothetical protein